MSDRVRAKALLTSEGDDVDSMPYFCFFGDHGRVCVVLRFCEAISGAEDGAANAVLLCGRRAVLCVWGGGDSVSSHGLCDIPSQIRG